MTRISNSSSISTIQIICLAIALAYPSYGLTQAPLPRVPTSTTLSKQGSTNVPLSSFAPEVYFINLKDGDRVRSPIRILFGVYRLGVSHAGSEKPSTGHHHLLIDTPLPSDLEKPIPFSDKYIHFGGGETEALIELPVGRHTLQLVFADGEHKPFIKTKSGTKIVVFSRQILIEVIK